MGTVISFALVGAALFFLCWIWDGDDLGSMAMSAAVASVAAAAMIMIMLGWMIWY